MNGYQIYNLAWVIIWALLGIGGVYGILMGNLAHIGAVCPFATTRMGKRA